MKPGTTRSVLFEGSLRDARAQRRALLAAGRPEPEPDVGPAPGTLDELAAEVFRARSPAWAPNTTRNRDDDYVGRIAPTLGALPLVEMTRSRVETWLAETIASGASRRAVVQAVATLRVILGCGVEWGRLSENPARRLRLPKPDPADRPPAERVLGLDDLRRLFASAGTSRTEAMLRAAGEAGLRRGEIVGLRWPDVNIAARRLDVRRQVVQERLGVGKGHRKVETTTKGGRARRVAISADFAAALSSWFAESVVGGGADATGYVWPGRGGGPMHDRSLAQALERAYARSGLVDDRGRAVVSPHRLRHSAASVMLAQGVPLTVVAAQLGHADPAITARIYAHLISDRDLDLAAAAFAASSDAQTERETERGESTETENAANSRVESE